MDPLMSFYNDLSVVLRTNQDIDVVARPSKDKESWPFAKTSWLK
jgi:hypothetical protein